MWKFNDEGAVPELEIWNLNTEQELVEILRKEGITGRRVISCNCPVRNYIQKHIPTGFVAVCAGQVNCWKSAESYEKRIISGDDLLWSRSIPDAHPIRTFITRFDGGIYVGYNDLVEV